MSAPAFDPLRPDAPFSLDVGGSLLHATNLLRHLSGKRVVCAGSWNDREVVAKIYIDPRRARIHAAREIEGIRSLRERGIASPPLLQHADCDNMQVLLFERIAPAVSALERWQNTIDEGERLALLRQLVLAVANHHQAGLVQEDLHLGNFLFGDGKLYTLDGASVRNYGAAVPHGAALDNLALLFAQPEPSNDRFAPELLQVYARQRGGTTVQPSALQRAIVHRRAERKREYLEKAFRSCSAFAVQRNFGQFSVWDREYDSATLRALLQDPDAALATGRLLKQGRTSTVGVAEIDGHHLLIKRYNLKNFWHACARALRETRASISWRNAHRLCFFEIATPRPVALVEKLWGPLKRTSYIICEYAEVENSSRYFRNENRTRESKDAAVRRICALFAKLDMLHIGHGDTKASNFLIGDQDVLLIDLDAMTETNDVERAARAHEKDMQRFLRNWDNMPELRAQFASCFARKGSTE